MARYNLGRVILKYKGHYNATTTYNRLDVVEYQGSSYMYIGTTAITGGTNPHDSTSWQLLLTGIRVVEGSLPDVSTLEEGQMVIVTCPIIS